MIARVGRVPQPVGPIVGPLHEKAETSDLCSACVAFQSACQRVEHVASLPPQLRDPGRSFLLRHVMSGVDLDLDVGICALLT